jgi:hypothetical protein
MVVNAVKKALFSSAVPTVTRKQLSNIG